MKAKHVFLTMGLALVMGAGIAASGAISMAKEIRGAKADPTPVTTMYLDTNKLSWYGDQSRAYLYGTGGNNGWPGQALTHETGSIYKLEVADMSKYQSVIFLRSNGTNVWNRTSKDGGTAINLPADWTTKNMFKFNDDWTGNEYDDGNYTGGWELYTPPATTYEVEVVINGIKRGDEEIGEGLLPDDPSLTYAQSWDGKWYTDEDCTEECTGVTSDVYTLYCEVVDHAYLQFTLDASRATDKFAETYLYTWDDGGIEEPWPGTKFTGNTFYVADDAKFIINAGDGKEQTENIDVSPVEEDTLRILNSTDGEGHYETIWESEIDEPAEEGYYIKGSRLPNAWKYAGATKMNGALGENIAHLMNYSATSGEEIRVCSWYSDRSPEQNWATLGDNGYSGYGEKSGDNFKFTKTGYYDVYAKYEDRDENPDDQESFMFYVAEHVDSYDIEMTAVMFEGPTKIGTSAQATQKAYSGSDFEPVQPDMSGFAKRGYYTDADCTIDYEPTKFSAAGHLYAKYTKAGYYMISEATSWSIDSAVPMTTAGIAETNKAECTVTVAAANEKYSFVYYNASGAMEGHNGLGGTYDFAETDGDNNVVFKAANTYYIYWSNGDGKIYIETVSPDMKKALAFVREFKEAMADACAAEAQETEVKAAWAQAAADYEELQTNYAAAAALVYQGGYSEDAEIREFAERYIAIYQQHASWNLANFMGWDGIAPTNYINGLTINRNVLVVTIIAVSTLAVSAGLVLFLLKRKRLVK